jgi:hypothetical protein
VYADDRWPVYILPVSSPPDREDVYRRATRLAGEHRRVWLIPQWSPGWDAEGFVEDALDAVCERVTELRIASWPLVLYHTPGFYRHEMVSLDASLGDQIRLLGYVLRDEHGAAVERTDLRPGGEVRLTLYWMTDSRVSEDYVVFAHILDESGWPRGQQDNQPRNGTYPTRAWVPNEWVVDSYRIPLAADAPMGDYMLEIGMYRPADGTRLRVSGNDADAGGDRILLAKLLRVR